MRPIIRKIIGGFLIVVGFILSPLSWWNDLVVNVPISYTIAWLMSLLSGSLFSYAFVGAYWLTNIAGLLMMHRGYHFIRTGEEIPKYTRREFLQDLFIALGYTVLIIALIKLGILKPLEGYFPRSL